MVEWVEDCLGFSRPGRTGSGSGHSSVTGGGVGGSTFGLCFASDQAGANSVTLLAAMEAQVVVHPTLALFGPKLAIWA